MRPPTLAAALLALPGPARAGTRGTDELFRSSLRLWTLKARFRALPEETRGADPQPSDDRQQRHEQARRLA